MFCFLAKRPKKLLVLINPNSGGGKSVKLFENQVAPLLKVVEVDTDVIGKYTTFHILYNYYRVTITLNEIFFPMHNQT